MTPKLTMKYLLPIFLICLQFCDVSWANSPNPYCIHNKTEIVYIKVNKTRQIEVTKPWYKKLSKTATKVEYYEEEEAVPKVTPVRECCEGYAMSELQFCEPVCSEGCPENSQCVEPEVCKCKTGYFSSLSQHDRKHFCAPICEKTCPEHSICVKPNECACRSGFRLSESKQCQPHCPSGCPFNGKCVGPNFCQCPQGYKSEKGSCLPICSLGDQCKNGECVDVEKCKCNFGFNFSELTHTCRLNLAIFEGSESQESHETHENTSKSAEDATENDADPEIATEVFDSNEAVDPSQVFEEYFETTTWNSLSTESEEAGSHKCPDDFVLYRGRCQPLKFAIDEIDCRLQPCTDIHARCMENGTCACQDGYRWYKKPLLSDADEPKLLLVKPICLSLKEYETLMQQQLEEENSNKKNDVEPSNFMSIFFIVLGVLVMTSALVYLGLRLVRTERGQLDVENKQLSCAYDNRACSEPEKSTI